jgi:hypothetical protein
MTVAAPSLEVASTSVGASGVVNGTTLTPADGSLEPAAEVATTAKV